VGFWFALCLLTLSRYVLIFLALWWVCRLSILWSVSSGRCQCQLVLASVSGDCQQFVSGLILLLEQPIRVDDIVTVGDQTDRSEHYHPGHRHPERHRQTVIITTKGLLRE
jgi:hypothetical protein